MASSDHPLSADDRAMLSMRADEFQVALARSAQLRHLQVDRPHARLIKEVIFYLGRPDVGIAAQLFAAHEAAVLGLDSDDPVHVS